MKNPLTCLFFSLFLIACGNSTNQQNTDAKAAVPASTSSTAIKIAEQSTVIAMSDEQKKETATELEATKKEAPKGDKAEALAKKTPQKKDESITGRKKAETVSTPSSPQAEAPVKETPKATTPTPKPSGPTTKPMETPKPNTQPVDKVKEVPPVETKAEPTTPTLPEFNHQSWDALLRKNVNASGKVNYKGFKKDRAALEAYIQALQANPIQDNWSKSKKIAYWINVYNAFTIKLIVDNYPVKSITDLHGGKPWDHKWIKIDGKTYTLNNIENDILRPQYKDARVHFAVNCAAKSCPPLLNRAWTADNLNRYYEQQAKAFINNSQYNKIGADKIEVSKIFEWYAADFGNLIDFLNKYANTKINAGATTKYLEYNWQLNE